MRWCLSACGPVTSSIPERWRDGGMRDAWVEEKKGVEHCLIKKGPGKRTTD